MRKRSTIYTDRLIIDTCQVDEELAVSAICLFVRMIFTFSHPPPKVDQGAFSGQRQGWKTPRGPSGSVLLLCV